VGIFELNWMSKIHYSSLSFIIIIIVEYFMLFMSCFLIVMRCNEIREHGDVKTVLNIIGLFLSK